MHRAAPPTLRCLVALAAAGVTPVVAQENASVRATLGARSVAVGELVTLDVVVTTDGARPERWDEPRLPDGLGLISTSQQSSMQFSMPGGRSLELRRSYSLLPSRDGMFRIPAITVIVEGRTFTTRPQTLTVIGGAGAAEGFGREPGVSIRSSFEPDSVYVGQQTVLTTEAVFSGDLRLRVSWTPQYEAPSPPGFWIEELADGAVVRTRITDARTLSEVYSYRRAYFPLAAGQYSIEPARLAFDVRTGLFGQTSARVVETDSLGLSVLPLPAAGQPASFRGAVGRYTMNASLAPDRVPAGEAAVLELTIEGTGNVRTLPAPPTPTIQGLTIHPPSDEAVTTETDGVIGGTKTFRWVIVPERAGQFRIGPIELSFFDPERGVYERIAATPFVLHATPAAQVADPAAPVGALRTRPAPSRALAWVESPWFAAVQGAPLLLALGLLARRRFSGRRRLPSRRALRLRRRQALVALTTRPLDGREFLGGLERFLREALADRLLAPELTSQVAADPIALLAGRGVPRPLASNVVRFLETLRQVRFAPAELDDVARRRLVERAQDLLGEVDRATKPPARLGRTLGAAVLALLTVWPAAAPEAQVTEPIQAFDAGVDAFHAGDAAAAASAFRAYLDVRPDDVNALYDFGLAARGAGRDGLAAWAWLRALRLAPRDAEIRATLLAAGVPAEAVEAAAPTLPFSRREVLLLASLFWLAGGTLLALRVARPTGWLLPGGVMALGVAGALALGAALPAILPERAVVTAASTSLRAAPDIRAEALLELPAATPVTVERRERGFLLVATAQGRQGWVEPRDVGTL